MAAAVVVASVVLPAPTVAAAQPGTAVVAEISKQARLSGGSVLLSVRTRCPEGAQVLEAFAYLTQDGQTSQFSRLPLVCDGRSRKVMVAVPSFPEAPFHTGAARATTFALIQLPGSPNTAQGGDTSSIRVRALPA